MSSLPPLRVGTSVCPALVCIRLGNPGGLGSSYLTFGDRNVFWSFQSKGVVTWLAFLSRWCLRCSTSDAVFKISSCCFSWVTGQKLACSRLQPLTYSLPAIVHWLANLRVQRKPSLWLSSAGGNRRAPSHAYKDLANNSHLWALEPWILVL